VRRNLIKPVAALVAAVILWQLVGFAQAYRIQYEYDELDRLVKVIHPAGETITYSYDPVGNRISKVVDLNIIPPTVVAFVIAEGQAQRSTVKHISAQFSEDVTITSDSLSVTGVGYGAVDLSSAVFDYNSVNYTATWELPDSLPDDQYTATLDSSKISDSNGLELDGNGDGTGGDDAIFEFHRLFGDATGDGTVNYYDLSLLALRWLDTPAETGLDTNTDNLISFPDFASFAENWLVAFSE